MIPVMTDLLLRYRDDPGDDGKGCSRHSRIRRKGRKDLPERRACIGDYRAGCMPQIEYAANVRFSNRPVGVKRFQTIHQCSVDVAHGLALLSGIGTKAVPSGIRGSGGTILSYSAAVRSGASAVDVELSLLPRHSGRSLVR